MEAVAAINSKNQL